MYSPSFESTRKCVDRNVVHTARRYYRLNGLVRSRDWRLQLSKAASVGNLLKLDHLEEVKVVTRFP
jgi:hypothetical protein